MVPTGTYKSEGVTAHLGGSQRAPKEAECITGLPRSLDKQGLGMGGLSRQEQQHRKRFKEHTHTHTQYELPGPQALHERLTLVSSLTRKQRATVPKRH